MKGLWDLPGHKALRVSKVPKEYKAPRDSRVRVANRGLRENKVPRAKREIPVILVPSCTYFQVTTSVSVLRDS